MYLKNIDILNIIFLIYIYIMEYLKKNIKEDSEKERKIKDDAIKAEWTHEQEGLLAKWCEVSACYRWLHEKAEKKFRAKHYKYTIPVIIMSTLAGTANFGIDSYVPEEYKQYAQMGIGSVNILAGIISTLQNFFRYAELMESHRSCGISWSKLQRDISVELALDPLRRKHAYDFLKLCRAEYDRLMEQSPSIPADIINIFKKQFKKNNDFKRPDICNGIEHCLIYEPTNDEKVVDILARTGNKIFKSARNLKLPNKLINEKNNKNKNKNNVVKTYNKTETLNELNELNNMKSVSAFLNIDKRNNIDKKRNIDIELTPINNIQNNTILDIIDEINNNKNIIDENNDEINDENNDNENNDDKNDNNENNDDEINDDENDNDENDDNEINDDENDNVNNV